MKALAILCALLICGACGGEAKNSQTESTPQETVAKAPLEPGPWTWVQGNLGGFWCAYRPLPGPIESGPSFPIEVRIADSEGGEALPLEVDQVAVDARMPEHGHGMLQRVEMVKSEGGNLLVRGMRLHMGGYWELYVDLTRGAQTERAQFVIQL